MTQSSRLPSTRPTTRRERIERNRGLKSKDKIFLDKNSPDKFEFDERVAGVFDDMLERSVPLYQECQNLSIEWCKHLAKPNVSIYDLGCSTGSLLLPLARSLSRVPGLRIIGVDNSVAMLNKARLKLKHFSNSIELIEANLSESFSFEKTSAVVMNYTLQFIPQKNRALLLKQIYNSLIPGGGLIINEKILGENERLSETFIEMHHNYKQDHGYSKMEISKKRDALENVLIPLKLSKTIVLLREAGFDNMDTFFKWNNFAGLIALK